MISPAWTGLKKPESDSEGVELQWQRWHAAAARIREDSIAVFAANLRREGEALLDPVFRHSPYLSRCVMGDPQFVRLLVEEGPDVAFDDAIAHVGTGEQGESEKDLMARLRRAKRRAHLAAGLADIASAWPLEKVTGGLSRFAETALRTTCRYLLSGLHDKGRLALPDREQPEHGCGLFVLGMGKLGALELNYSSDIDLIVLFDPDVVPSTGEEDLQRMLTRFAQAFTRIIDAQTAHGYVFRTDLRLRPDPGSTPPAISTVSADTYYRESARNWERAAMIKARTVAGDTARGNLFLEGLHPFIWRRHLDFEAMQDIRAIKHQIDASRSRDNEPIKGRNVKLGRGGIREIEFFVQAQQLIWGGRDSSLRVRGTCQALDILVATGHVTHGAALELKKAYRFLRTLEHRLQMVDDRQTHSLPESEEGIEEIAAFSSLGAASDLERALFETISVVERHYSRLFEEKTARVEVLRLDFTGEAPDPGSLESLASLGYGDPERIARTVQAWTSGSFPALRNEEVCMRLMRLAPAALTMFADSRDPDAVFFRFDEFLSRLPSGTQLFSLLSAHPDLLGLLGEIMDSAPRLSKWLTRNPTLFDSVLSREFADLDIDDEGLEPEIAETARRGLVRLFYTLELSKSEMTLQLADATTQASDLQDLLDAVRRWANDKVFQIGVHLLQGMLTPVEAAKPLSDIADVCIAALLPGIEREFTAEHGRIPGAEFAIIAFGKLGSREMTVSSDLDLLFLYDHGPGHAESNGRKPLPAIQYYARLCRRLITAITAPTREGRLYEVDMRLRPSGNAGPIACSLDSFETYQHENAWTWEHQALTRARVVCADGALSDAFEKVRRAVLVVPRTPDNLAREIISMRERIRRENRDREETVQHMPGGLLDIEFIAQYLELLHANRVPGILAGNTIRVFELAGEHGLMDPGTAGELAETAVLWRNLQGMARLTVGNDFTRKPSGSALMDQMGGRLVTDALLDSVDDAAGRTRELFHTVLVAPAGISEVEQNQS